MGEIDDPHNAHDQGHSDPDEAVNAANENTGYKRLKETIHIQVPFMMRRSGC
jgi:hypothetical protein